MSNIIIKDKDGVSHTYTGVNSILTPDADSSGQVEYGPGVRANSLTIIQYPNKMSYKVNTDVFDPTGLIIGINLDNGKQVQITDGYTYDHHGVFTTEGTHTVNFYVAWGVDSLSLSCSIRVRTAGIFGVQWEGTSSPIWSRTDDASEFTNPNPYYEGMTSTPSSPFDDIYPWAGMTAVEDTEAGTLIRIPKFWYKWTRSGSTMKLQISNAAETGFSVAPAFMDKGDGVGERDIVYVGKYHCATGTYKSTTGLAQACSITRSTARTSIHSLGSTIWQYDYAMLWTIQMLYLVEFADWNSQLRIGYGCSASGSKVNNGATDYIEYHTGTTATARTTYGFTKYRNIEGLWDNVLDWCDGIYFGGTDNANVYCILNPANFSDTTGGTLVSTRPTSSLWTASWSQPTETGFEWALYPATGGGGSTTYICDDCYYDASGVVLCVGGYYRQLQAYGLFYLNGGNSASVAYSRVGCRLQKL